jgi:hypothetical protein
MVRGMAIEDNAERADSAPRRDHVFISHHSSRYEAAKRVKAALAQAGVHGWLAPDDVSPGSAFDTQIVDAMREARAIVLLLSPEADQSRHVKRELMLADDAGIAVLPVRLEPFQAEGLAYFLKDRQWIDWFDGADTGLDRLVAAVRGLDAASSSPLGAPSPPGAPPLRSPPAARRAYRRWLVAGVVLAAIAGSAGYVVYRNATPETLVRPGLWLNKREMIALTYPVKVAEEETRQIRTMIENDPNPEECIPEDVARDPDVRLFDPGNKGGCALTGFQIAPGRMSGFLLCPVKGAKDASMSIVFTATYSREQIVMDSDVTIAQGGGSLRFKARDSSHWIADTCNARDR